jgi:hypothetical protein
VLERGVRGGEVEGLRVEVFSRPPPVLLVLLVVWVGQCFEEIGIAARSAAVFGWAGVRPVDGPNA